MSVNKAIWIAKLLYRRGRLSRRDILDAWAESDEGAQPMAVSTFYDNRHLLLERYGIRLRAEGGLYSLDIRDSREQEFLSRLLGDGADKPIAEAPLPTGYAHIATLSGAMERRTCVDAEYSPFDKPAFTTRFAPYCLRVFRGRCYAVGFSSAHGAVRTFALDRIVSLSPTSEPYPRAPLFDARKYFAGSFGVYGGDNLRLEHVVIDADRRNAAFIRSLPFHSSQRESRSQNHEYPCRFELDISITADFVHELLYYGPGIKVIAPESLRAEIIASAKAVLRAYGEENAGR